MQSCKPEIKDNFQLEIAVDNQIQEKEINEEKINILNFLRVELKNGKINLTIRLNEEGENVKTLSPYERLNKMLEHNKYLEQLKKDLNLEID